MSEVEVVDGHVRVRMYRQGLGDCFLLTFPGRERAVHVLIDCGVILGTEHAAERMRAVADQIADETGGHLDLVIATHEHWDHLSGFLQARAEFDAMSVGQVWMAWTEDPGNPLGRELRAEREHRRRVLIAAVQRLHNTDLNVTVGLGIRDLLTFFGEEMGAVTGATTRDALTYLTGREDAKTEYLHPGTPPREVPGVPDLDVFVLGPPADRTLLSRSRPRKGQGEVYEVAALSADASILGHAEEQEGNPEWDGHRYPFDASYHIPWSAASEMEYFRSHYGFGGEDAPAWRRIDHDWLGAAGQVALNLDNDTNNTSLVLAFRSRVSGRVLLFPADAQIGNWTSWSAYEWMVPEGQSEAARITVRDLLENTVLYKVGHHGSHNATLQDEGLERMTHPDLVAMIPVDSEMAERKRWKMPFPPLLDRLTERTRGRVLRVDFGRPTEEELQQIGMLTRRERATFLEATSEDPLFVDLRIAL